MQENRISAKFQELKSKGQKALITFITAGDPNLDTTENLVLALEKAGADIIELGVPFSDPLADGPTIQKASQRAIKNEVNLRKILDLVVKLRSRTEIPIVLMTYLNPLYQFGLKDFVTTAVKAGVDGLIIPDLPFEEKNIITRFIKSGELALIPLVAPTSTEKRIIKICEEAQGFIYCVSVAGITGIRANVSNNLDEFIELVKVNTSLPIAIGFGVSTALQCHQMGELCDGVIVGSALVKIIEEKGIKSDEELVPLVTEFKGALLGSRRTE